MNLRQRLDKLAAYEEPANGILMISWTIVSPDGTERPGPTNILGVRGGCGIARHEGDTDAEFLHRAYRVCADVHALDQKANPSEEDAAILAASKSEEAALALWMAQ